MTNHHKLILRRHHHLLPPPPPTATRSSSTIQACAACRYQRRKCAPDCILAPYFPHDRQRQFQNAHKLFGVSNITKIIRHLDPPQKDEAMRTIIYQSDVRAQDPVGGCYRIIRELQRQIEFSRAELEIVLQQLAMCRALAVQNQNQDHPQNNQDQILIEDISNVNNPQLYDDDHHHNHQSLDLDLNHIHLQQENKDHDDNNAHDHDQYVFRQQDLNNNEGESGDHVVPLQQVNSWAMMHDSSPSPGDCFEVKPQPIQTLHASVCDDFKSLLLNDIPSGDKHEIEFEFKETNEPSEENFFNENNHKAIIKEEKASYQEHKEEHEIKDANLSTLDCTALLTLRENK